MLKCKLYKEYYPITTDAEKELFLTTYHKDILSIVSEMNNIVSCNNESVLQGHNKFVSDILEHSISIDETNWLITFSNMIFIKKIIEWVLGVLFIIYILLLWLVG